MTSIWKSVDGKEVTIKTGDKAMGKPRGRTHHKMYSTINWQATACTQLLRSFKNYSKEGLQ